MSGTPCAALASTQNGAGARRIAIHAARNAQLMKATASHETRRTPRRPKYSLMRSVRTNTTGQKTTPAVKVSVPEVPNRLHCTGSAPSVCSSEKIFTPRNSASSASVTRNPASAKSKRVDRDAVRCSGAFPCAGCMARLFGGAETVRQRPPVRDQRLQALEFVLQQCQRAELLADLFHGRPKHGPGEAHAADAQLHRQLLRPRQARLDTAHTIAFREIGQLGGGFHRIVVATPRIDQSVAQR